MRVVVTVYVDVEETTEDAIATELALGAYTFALYTPILESDLELPGMWEEADFLGGSPDVVRDNNTGESDRD